MTRRVVLVVGAAGHAVTCVLQTLLDRGAHVVSLSRSPQRLRTLQDALPPAHRSRLETVQADISDPTAAQGVRDRVLARHGRLDGVVASLGTRERGTTIARTDLGTWRRLLHDNLTPHFVAAQTFAPLLRSGGAYVTLAGAAAREPTTRAAALSVTGAGQTMLLRVLAEELAVTGARFHEVCVLTPVAGHWFDYPPQPGWLTAQEVGTYVADVLEPEFPRADTMLLTLPDAEAERGCWPDDIRTAATAAPALDVTDIVTDVVTDVV